MVDLTAGAEKPFSNFEICQWKNAIKKLMLCLENLAVMLAEKELEFDIQAKHLYHDREEITVHIALK